MENSLPKNRPSSIKSIRINRSQFNHICTAAAVAMGEKIARDFAKLKDDIAPACDKTFVMMKNKQVWFDRNNAALYPKFERFNLPSFCTSGQPSRNYSVDFEGFHFVAISPIECTKSFAKGSGNPYLNVDHFRYFPIRDQLILTDSILANNGGVRFFDVSNGDFSAWDDSDQVTLVPIHRLRGKNASAMNYVDSILAWLENGLIPEGLTFAQENFYKNVLNNYPKVKSYVTASGGTITFDSAKFSADVLAGTFTEKVFGYDFDIRGTLEGVLSGERKFVVSVGSLKKELLECDHKRANIQVYNEKMLTDVNRGHWELFETGGESSDEVAVDLPEEEILVARPPQLDVRLNATCAIDFGTKSTVVVCLDGEARMLRIGKGDYSKAPVMADFENPTVIELRDIQEFLAAYRSREGRPFTEWEQVTVSHQAAAAIFRENLSNSSVYNSVFSELKQWAQDEKNYPVLKDLQGHSQEVQLYVDTEAIDDGGFDPIEIYAYYLGLYINNMHHQIYLDYILSFPVNYKKDVREKIRESFERGIKKSLPPALLKDEEMMRRFRVYLGASEPAAYAVSALEGYNLQPQVAGEKVAYGVFDFGGGTTDFDFGIEYVPEKIRRNFVIEQFGFSGDVLLGGENLIELLAYEVYKANLGKMREAKIPFALPAGCENFAGAETLVSWTKDADAHMNNHILAEKLRPLWENSKTAEELNADTVQVILFSSEKKDGSDKVAVQLKIDVEGLKNFIEARIRQGVENFFQSLYSAFSGKNIYPIHILLAGNSCKSPVVKKIFDEFIENESKRIHQDAAIEGEIFKLYMPLGLKENAEAETEPPAEEVDLNIDRQLTGKTGVAFGLLRCRYGGKDVKIINRNVDEMGEINFPYYLGDAGADGNTFTVRIGREIGYDIWNYFTAADEPEFELYYTTAPSALQGDMPVEKVSKVRCFLDEGEATDDENVGVYIRKVGTNAIEYAVGRAENFAGGDFRGKVYRQVL